MWAIVVVVFFLKNCLLHLPDSPTVREYGTNQNKIKLIPLKYILYNHI